MNTSESDPNANTCSAAAWDCDDCSILLIDDDPFQLDLITSMLLADQCQVLTALGGAAALEQFVSLKRLPDLVICDLQMPDVDGIEVLRALHERGFDGKVILISGEDQRILDTAKRLAGEYRLAVEAALGKPFSRESLLEHVNSALQRADGSQPLRSVSSCDVPVDVEAVRQALERQELSLHFQPKVGFGTRQVVGVEALLRWEREPGRMAPPDSFLPLAEQGGLMNRITDQVITLALDQQRAWMEEGISLDVSINLAMEDLHQLDFPERLGEAVASRGLDPGGVVLEVTESQVVQQMGRLLDVLTRLRLRGFPLSIDDFGTGYSSLEQLREAPFTELKIDRGFVRGACHDPKRRAILEASISLAHSLGMAAVAEGVEDEEEWDLLLRLGCDQVQGYYVSRPLPADALGVWLKEYRRADL